MSERTNSYNTWIETGYQLFGEMGPEELNIKALSEACGLPRPNFYYHFSDKDDLIDKLLKKHFENFLNLENDLKESFENFLPDLHLNTVKYKKEHKFHWQLFRHRHILKYNQVYLIINNTTSDLIIPKFKKYYKLRTNTSVTKSLWETLLDAWFSNIDFEKFTVNELSESTENTMKTILSICNKF
jgi:AcrR family transcriptional regulator